MTDGNTKDFSNLRASHYQNADRLLRLQCIRTILAINIPNGHTVFKAQNGNRNTIKKKINSSEQSPRVASVDRDLLSFIVRFHSRC